MATNALLSGIQCWHWRDWLLCRAQFNLQLPPALLEQLADEHEIELPPWFFQSVPVRQAEYLAGRLLLRQAQLKLGLALQPVLPGSDRSPQWPAGQQGSVSHSGGLVLVGLGANPQLRLGIDVEHWLSAAQYQQLAAAILLPAEQNWCQHYLAQRQHWTLPRLLTLIFAAKEALYKALYPQCRHIMEFSAARVQALTSQQIMLQLTVDWSAEWRAGSEIWLDYQPEPEWVQVLTSLSFRPII